MTRRPRLIELLLPILAGLFSLPALPSIGADAADVIPVSETELIEAQLKKAVIVRGTIAEIKVFKTSGNVLVKFEEGDVAIFIRKDDFEKNSGWDDELEAQLGLEVCVAGQVKIYRGQLEVVIVGPEQINLSPAGFDLAKIPLPESPKKSKKKAVKVPGAIAPSKGDYPDLPLMLEEASVQAVVFYLVGSGMKIKDDPYDLPVDFLRPAVATVNAVVTKVEGGGPMQIAFPDPEKDSKGRIQAVLDQLAESYGKWPSDCLLTIDVDFDSRAFKDDPSTLVIASLIQSLVSGDELAGNLVISADVESDGSIAAPAANVGGQASNHQILEAISENADAPVRYICADMPTAELNDFALDERWDTLGSVTVLAVPTLQDALQLIFAAPQSPLGEALAGFDQTQAVIKSDGGAMVKNSHVQERVIAAGKAWPKNKSAVFYLYYARGKVPRSYSLAYTHHTVSDIQTQLRFLQISNPPDPKEKFGEFETKLEDMSPNLDPELDKLARAIKDFADEASSAVQRPKEGRAKERQDEKLKESDAELSEQIAALATRIAGGGEAEDEEE